MSNFICQNEVNMANEPLKVQQPLLESSSEMDKLRCITNTALSPVTKFFFSRILSDGEFQLADPRSAKILDKVVEEVQKCGILVPQKLQKNISAKIFKENLHTSVKILQICMDLQDSVQRSLQNPEEKILQICTDSQRSKTWDVSAHSTVK